MTIYIGILTHNSMKTLPWNFDDGGFWQSVRGAHVLVLDQGSTDGTAQYLLQKMQEHGNLKVVSTPFNRSIVDGRQRLIDLLHFRLESGDVVVLLDHDTQMKSVKWLDNLTKLITSNDEIGVIGSFAPQFIEKAESGGWYFRPVPYDVTTECDVVSACVTAYRADIFLLGAGFDPLYAPMWHEDADLCLQAKALGYQVWSLTEEIGMKHMVGHKQTDTLLFHRNMAFLRRKWEGKGLTLAEHKAIIEATSQAMDVPVHDLN